MSAAVLALVLAAVAEPEPIACAAADTYRFAVVRPQNLGTAGVDPGLEGLPFRVEARGVNAEAERAVADGKLVVCLHGVTEGTFVDALPRSMGARVFRLMYPGAAGIPVSRRDKPTLVVCEEKVDCRVDDGQALGLLRRVFQEQAASSAKLSGQLSAVLRSLQHSQVDFGAFARVVELKARQVDAAAQASELLSTWENRAQEISDRFRRDAVLAIDWKGKEPLQEMNQATLAYNPVHDRLREQADAIRQSTAGYWGAARADTFQGLVDEALAVHEHLKELNGLTGLVNACNAKLPSCPDRAAARRQVAGDVARIADQIDAGLRDFAVHRRSFEDAQKHELFDGSPDATGATTP